MTNSAIDAFMDQAKAARFDTIFMITGSTPSSSLMYAIGSAHSRGLKVQAWWCVGLSTSGHPSSWNIQSLGNSTSWLNFHNTDAQAWVADTVVKIAASGADGVTLDYIRYPDKSTVGVADTDVPNTVKQAYQKLKAAYPNKQLTASVFVGQGGSANVKQNWGWWLRDGYIDAIYPMAYFATSENSLLQKYINEWNTLPNHNRIYPGLSVYTSNNLGKIPVKSWSEMKTQLDMAKNGGHPSFAIFDSVYISSSVLSGLASYE
jgi:uncharacterized lipoprotein YddW (UPF0748 family)